ncbi:condensin complex subunit 1 [Phlebotomus argentipes]|uniref:condensin complex subunit 1 n=1 Tax=Phlebotomus argentipes TaxID=94469 RepID=UPI0028936687|nr:condensin complex subunit 1 [Phlebotomus argentipes]
MQFEFIIPSTPGDLRDIDAPNNGYYVKEVHQAAQIPGLLKRAKAASQNQILYIFDHFDTFFSVVEKASSVPPHTAMYAFDLLFATTDQLGKSLASKLEQSSLEVKDRDSLRNATKMILYLDTALMKALDEIYQNNCASADKKKARTIDTNADLSGWIEKRSNSLIQLYNMLQLPLEKLWEKTIVEEAFVTMTCDVAYMTLELEFIKSDSAMDVVFQILGTAIKRYNHALHFPVRILSILRSCEPAACTIADGVCLLEEEFGINTLCAMLMNDLLETLSNDIEDAKTVKHSTLFLTRLAETAPNIITPQIIAHTDKFLELDAYQLRICVLQIIGDIICNQLTSEDLSDEMKEVREEFLDYLYDHGADINSYVRSKVIQIWTHLKQNLAIPLVWQNKVLRLAVQRLEDKSAFVRKYAVILITSFIERNPFAGKLSMEEVKQEVAVQEQKLQDLREKMLQNERSWNDTADDIASIVRDYVTHMSSNGNSDHSTPPSLSQENLKDLVMGYFEKKEYLSAVRLIYATDMEVSSSEVNNMQLNEKCVYYLALMKSYYFIWLNHEALQSEYDHQQQTVQFHVDCIDFMDIIEGALPKIGDLLLSKTNGDVCEAINFFTLGYQFRVKGCLEGMHKMLSVIWSKDKEKKDAVSAAFKKILFTTDQKGRQHAAKAVKNLCDFIGDISIGRYISLELLINDWVANNDIDHEIIQMLFERFTMKLTNTTEKEANEALQLLVVISRTKPLVAMANMGVIESIMFSERGLSDPDLYAHCLDFLLNLNVGKNSEKRFAKDSEITGKIVESLHSFFFTVEVENFDEIAVKTTDFIYAMVQSPDAVCEDMLSAILRRCNEIASECADEVENVRLSQNSKTTQMTLSHHLINRFIYVLGMVGMKELIFLDTYVYTNIKYRQELKNMKKNTNGRAQKTISSPSLNTSASSALKKTNETEEENLVGASAENTTAEVINYICEEVLLLKEQSILRKFIPGLNYICRNPAMYNNEEFQRTIIMTMIRLMCVSSKFCEPNMDLLMNILMGTKSSHIKSNIIVGFADFTFRSPNQTEPWSGQFFSTLHDSDLLVRLTTVKMLSYLITNEMLRVKSQISDLALRLVDDNSEIQTTCEEFFKEISSKPTLLYNVMPDIISRLGDPSLNLEEDKYRTVMRFILKLIRKDKQIENLIDKLCLRFGMTSTTRQSRDIAFCLSLLSYNEKSIKKLIEHVNCFKKDIFDDDVYDCLKSIITNTGKLAKQALKDCVKELEYKLEKCRNSDPNEASENVEENAEQRRSQQKEQQVGRRKARRRVQGRQKKRAGRFGGGTDDDDDDDDDFESDNENKVPTKTQPKRTVTRNTSRVVQSDNSSSSEEDVPEKRTVGRRRTKKLRN